MVEVVIAAAVLELNGGYAPTVGIEGFGGLGGFGRVGAEGGHHGLVLWLAPVVDLGVVVVVAVVVTVDSWVLLLIQISDGLPKR